MFWTVVLWAACASADTDTFTPTATATTTATATPTETATQTATNTPTVTRTPPYPEGMWPYGEVWSTNNQQFFWEDWRSGTRLPVEAQILVTVTIGITFAPDGTPWPVEGGNLTPVAVTGSVSLNPLTPVAIVTTGIVPVQIIQTPFTNTYTATVCPTHTETVTPTQTETPAVMRVATIGPVPIVTLGLVGVVIVQTPQTDTVTPTVTQTATETMTPAETPTQTVTPVVTPAQVSDEKLQSILYRILLELQRMNSLERKKPEGSP